MLTYYLLILLLEQDIIQEVLKNGQNFTTQRDLKLKGI